MVPEPSINPRVDAAVEEIKNRVGHPVPCPCCGGTSWKLPVDLLRVMYVTQGDPDAIREDLDAAMGGLPMLALVCAECSFVRWHFIADQ
jgi:hypothetical protein